MCVCVSVRLLSSTSLRPLFLLSVSLLGLMLLERWKPNLPIITGKPRVIMVFKTGLLKPELHHYQEPLNLK